MKKTTLVLVSMFLLCLLPSATSAQLVPTFATHGEVRSVTCALFEPPLPKRQCTVLVVSTTNKSQTQTIQKPVLCVDEMAATCSHLKAGDPAMIFGTDHWSYRLAHHVGIEILPHPKPKASRPNSKSRQSAGFDSQSRDRASTSGLARLGMGQKITFGARTTEEPWTSEQLTLRFAAVPEDSRCPEDVPCAWQGSAAIELEAWLDGSFQGTFPLVYQSGASDVQQIGSYRVSVVDLAPETHSRSTINPKEYSIVLKAVRLVR